VHLVRKGTPSARTRARLERVGAALENVRSTCDVAARLELDPVAVVHRYAALEDRELVGLIASAVAFGNVKALRAKLEEALRRLGPDIAATADDPATVLARLRGWKHRVYQGEDLARLLVGARSVQRASGSLGRRFAADLQREGDLRAALTAFTRAIREAGGLTSGRGNERRGSSHILADPSRASGCKRLLLYLRWMVRPADGVDLGLWDVPTSALLVPVDVHIHKLGRNLGFTRRKTTSWKTTEEITAALRRFDPADPVKYDFALCHLGMLRRCPSRRQAARCLGCAVKPVCRHWESAAATSGASLNENSSRLLGRHEKA
jgi:uncharacterized protein (TIGR02757 family)